MQAKWTISLQNQNELNGTGHCYLLRQNFFGTAFELCKHKMLITSQVVLTDTKFCCV